MNQITPDTTLDILAVVDEMESTLFSERIKREFPDNVNFFTVGKNYDNDFETYNDRAIDLILVDKQFARGDIFDALKHFKKQRVNAEIIVLSSDEDEKLTTRIKEAGAYDFIYKDRSAVDKVIYTIKEFKSKKFLRRQNQELKATTKKSNTTAVIIGIVAAIAIAAIVYLLT